MSRVIVITSGKGGVGKTTSTANISMALAKQGHRVAVVDADFGLRNLDLILGLENRIVYTALDVLSGECSLEQALVRDKRQPHLSLLPAAQNRMKDAVTPNQMKDLVGRLELNNDYVLIDCPAGIEQGFQNAIAAAREAIIVTTPEISAVRDADRVIGLLEANDIKRIRLLVNRIRPAMVIANNMMSVQDVEEILAIPLVGVVPDDERVIVSANQGEPLVLEDPGNITSKAAIAYHNIARRLDGEKVDFVDLSPPPKGLLARLRSAFSR
ncbi:MAG: septum site-determining protein MinD [Oscillatoriales cyanobacterium RM2_1_1]|nr:septum site-determining protein MinD [Oscillatoriales cyanobacterium SM2_3_0]NJO45196.1 septum site-determining protein MinD [Oscillatoriales cyanobacterium RM2_1_1]